MGNPKSMVEFNLGSIGGRRFGSTVNILNSLPQDQRLPFSLGFLKPRRGYGSSYSSSGYNITEPEIPEPEITEPEIPEPEITEPELDYRTRTIRRTITSQFI